MSLGSWIATGVHDVPLEVLREDGGFVLYRTWREAADGTRHEVLTLLPASDQPTPAVLDRLTHEYELKDQLEDSWAVRPLELVRERGRTFLVLGSPSAVLLDRLLGAPLEVGLFLRLAIALARALGRLHERGLVHKDVKPGNLLVDSAIGRAWLTGFGIASPLPRERQSPEPPEFIAGTLAYMAPEQTGRMNRSIDSRSDLYSLGVTLYEMLTGSLPFVAADPMEWVHCHVARRPVPPDERVEHVPAAASAIIMKLLAKTPEERYQTAYGAESDLRRCLAEWETGGSISEFPLGNQDVPDRLLVPEKLYGRASEIETLLDSFDRVVASGRPALVLVSGYAGIGKSSVVNELHKALVPPRGLLASGKFDQYKRDIPYATLAQAFQSVLRSLLGKSEGELSRWRDALQDALGPNGQLIVDLIPELQLIIGEQPPVADLAPQDVQRRFQFVFRRFIGVFATPQHPLALFLDDLQWLDAATLDLLENLLTQSDVQHLMVIGAYRDNEVDSAHPLLRKLQAIHQSGARVQDIVLAPLTHQDLRQLLADTLHCEPERAAPLARLIHEKTAGNPFFAIQFISALVEESLLTFDYGAGHWSWDLQAIRAKGHTHNVVDLMVGKLARLPVATQTALQPLACIGNSAEFALLEMLSQGSNEGMHRHLWEAVRAGLIFRTEHSYRFLHDRVQEAVYSLIPEELRAQAHLRVGRLLAAHTPPEKRGERIFEIVNQLNRGAALVTSREEREQLAELNLLAGKRAKASTAYESALSYIIAGSTALDDNSWEDRPALAFQLELHRAECEFLSGRLSAAEDRLAALSPRASNTAELATVARLRVSVYTTLDQNDRAVAICLDYLRHLGVEWSLQPTEEEVRREYERIWSQVGSRQIEDLIDLPVMTDLEVLDVLDVLTDLLTPALFCAEALSSLVICRIVNLSLEHGNSDGSCFAYVWLAIIAGPRFGNYEAGFRFGQLGYDLVEKRGLKRFQARTYYSFGDIVLPWTRHFRDGRLLVRRAFDAANEIGDLSTASICCDHLTKNLLAAGEQLVEAQREAESGLQFVRKVRYGRLVDHLEMQLGLIRTLRGLTRKFGSFDDDQFDELRFERYLASNPRLAELECWYWVRKMQARVFAGDYAAALDASLSAQRRIATSPSKFMMLDPLETAEYHLYGALAHAASWDSALPERRRQHLNALAGHHRRLEECAENGPENFAGHAALVGAEIARIEGRDLDAMRLYEQAIGCAQANGFIHNEALANEFAGRFYAARGLEKIAHIYLRDARYSYLRWGADGKVRQLDEWYPRLSEEKQTGGPTSTIGTPVEQLDLATVIKVSQAVSGEMVQERLIGTLMRTALEHAGAERGLLILSQGELRIEAEAVTDGETVSVRRKEAVVDAAPESIVQYVARTRQHVILDDAAAQNPFSTDAYIRERQARSILCLPLVHQGQLIGVLYLENNLAPRVFTPARIAMLKVVASQAAISLENTRLYRDLAEREAKIRRLVDANIIGIFIFGLEGRIIEANDAFLQMVGYDREDLVAGRLRWHDLIPPEWLERQTQHCSRGFGPTGTQAPVEKEYLRRDGSRLSVLIGAASFDETGKEGVAFVLDLSERKQAEANLRDSERRYHEARLELAHANRTATLGQMSASIAHEINQPVAATVTNAQAALRFLDAQEPNIEEVRQALTRIARLGHRIVDVVGRIRALVQKAPPREDEFEINEAIDEVISLTQGELAKNGVSLHREFAARLPLLRADRIQLQQVVLNLINNAVEAMSSRSAGARELRISTRDGGSGEIVVAVQDSGPGLDAQNPERVFAPFYGTKPGGLGIGLSICRSIIESHEGRLWAEAGELGGASFVFAVPVHRSPDPERAAG